MTNLIESGNVFDGTADIKKEFAPKLLKDVQALIPSLQMQPHIGSAGFKIASGDMDVFVDERAVIELTGAPDEKAAKKVLAGMILKKGLEVAVKGRNVHVKMPLPDGTFGQVDIMVIPDAADVAPWHQHGPRGSYDDPDFKGGHVFILINSIGKYLGVKFDAFGGKLLSRETNDVVAKGRDQVAKILLNPNATGDDLNSVKSIMRALANDPHKDEKLAQARSDASKGIINLHESVAVPAGSPSWFRTIDSILR
jgi:hypothetical protein